MEGDLTNSVTMVEKFGVSNVGLKEVRLETREIAVEIMLPNRS
jgi:hypothetical protein